MKIIGLSVYLDENLSRFDWIKVEYEDHSSIQFLVSDETKLALKEICEKEAKKFFENKNNNN